jgi:hypothetical protein
MMTSKYLKDYEREFGFPFTVFKVVNDVNIKPGIDYSHLPVNEDFGFNIIGKLNNRVYKCLDWYADKDHIRYVYDTRSFSGGYSYAPYASTLNIEAKYLTWMDAHKMNWKDRDCISVLHECNLSKEFAPISKRHEYIATRAYFTQLSDGGSQLDNWLSAECWIEERFQFTPNFKIPLYA